MSNLLRRWLFIWIPPTLLCFLLPLQPPLNAQMLAQRHRELYSQQHRQRQLMQQRAMLMRQQQSFGSNLPPSAGVPVQLTAGRLPQGPPQQFPFPPNYGTNPGNPPTSTSPFSQLAPNPEVALANRSNMVNRGMMGSVGGQFGSNMNPQMQQNIFQYSGSGVSQSVSFKESLLRCDLLNVGKGDTSVSWHNFRMWGFGHVQRFLGKHRSVFPES